MFKIRKRVLSAVMSMVLLSTMLLQPLSDNNAKAASSSVKYIKTVKVFTKEKGTLEDAKAWCDAQDENKDSDNNNNWNVIEGNLNDGAEGELNSAVGVFLVYQTTTDANEAVTDLAVMNERGNYSSAEYQRILTEQKEVYKDIVSDMKDMLKEYRTNYTNKIQSAINVHDFLNIYIEDDSEKLLGDLLLDISDDDLVELLLQANGQVLLTIQDQLSYACDTKDSTWLDRMEKLGSYDKMVKSLANTKKITASNAKAALKKKYNDRAVKLLESWEDVYMHFEFVNRYESNNGKADMSDEEWNEFIAERQKQLAEDTKADNVSADDASVNADFSNYVHEVAFLRSLNNYVFDGATLMAYFAHTYDEVSGDNITKLYPLAAALTDGQIGALNESVSLYTLIESAIYATTSNGYEKGKLAEYAKQVDIDKESKEKLEDSIDKTKEMIAGLQSADPISVYEGVDREMFSGGVAVTSTAKAYSDIVPENWTDSFMGSGTFSKTAIGMAAGALCFSVASIACANTLNNTLLEIASLNKGNVTEKIIKKTYEETQDKIMSDLLYVTKQPDDFEFYVIDYSYKEFKELENEFKTYRAILAKDKNTVIARGDFEKAALQLKEKSSQAARAEGQKLSRESVTKLKILQGLKIGFAVVAILLAVADIAMTTFSIYKYYKRDHVDVPKFIVDVSYEEDKASSFINYKNVLSTDGTAGDLNGGGGKQWLALYSTYDRSAGNPILAPDDDDNTFIYRTGEDKAESGYSPLHMFGTVNTAQNLTYADGESGYSFSDENKGTYLYFKRDANPYYGDENDSKNQVATTLSKDILSISGGIGLIIGFLAMYLFLGRKREKEENISLL